MQCRQIESWLPAFEDGETDEQVTRAVQAHLAVCASCAAEARAARVARDLLRARAAALREPVPPGVAARLAARLRAEHAAAHRVGWLERGGAMAAAALAILVLWISLELVPLPSAALYAAQVVIDHVRCLYLSAGTIDARADTNIDAEVGDEYGLRVHVPPSDPAGGLTLLGVRRCPFAFGPHAHVRYRIDDQPLSLYITPGRERTARAFDLLGHVERIWSLRGRTYAIVARGVPGTDLDRVEAYFRAAAE